jgi:hypothetical protein
MVSLDPAIRLPIVPVQDALLASNRAAIAGVDGEGSEVLNDV